MKNFCRFTAGWKLEQRLVARKNQAAFYEERSTFKCTFYNRQGDPVPCEVTLVHVSYQGNDAIAAYCRDLRELVQTIEQNTGLKRLAYYDSLTGTSSRVAFMQAFKSRFKNLKKTLSLCLSCRISTISSQLMIRTVIRQGM